MTPLERAAKALANGERIGALPEPRHYRLAREVIASIREPSEFMLEAAAYTMPGVMREQNENSQQEAWKLFRRMIDALLTEDAPLDATRPEA